MISILRSMWLTFLHVFHKTETVEYPEVNHILLLVTEEELSDTRCREKRKMCCLLSVCSRLSG